MSFDAMFGLWQEGQRRLQDADPSVQPALERVVDAVVRELRQRLGGRFRADELAELYLVEGTDWVFDLARRVAPRQPEAWDVTTVGGAAFARYVREASDYGGGRRVVESEE